MNKWDQFVSEFVTTMICVHFTCSVHLFVNLKMYTRFNRMFLRALLISWSDSLVILKFYKVRCKSKSLKS